MTLNCYNGQRKSLRIRLHMYIKTHAVNSQQEFIYCIYYIVKYVHEMRTMFKHDGGHTIV